MDPTHLTAGRVPGARWSRRRALRGLLLGTAGVAVLAACGGTTPSVTTSASATESRAASATTSSAAAPAASGAAVSTQSAGTSSSGSVSAAASAARAGASLRFSFFGDNAEAAIWTKIAQDFGAGAGVQVTPEHIPSDYFTKVQAEVAAGDAADVILMEDKPTAGYAQKGVFHALDPYIGTDSTFKLDDYYPVLFDGLRYQGKLYGLPQHWLVHMLLYNKAHFQQAGLPLPAADWKDASWNWDAFLGAAKKLTVSENGKITRYGFALSGYAWTYWRMWVWQNGGDVVSPDLKHSVLDQTPAIDGIQFYADLANVQHVAPTAAELKALNNPGFTDLFAQGKAAMTSSAPYLFDLRTQLKDIDWDVVPEPMKAKCAAPLWPDSISMNAATKAPELSWQLLRYVLGPQGQTTITTLGRGVPVLKSIANSPAFLQTGKAPQNIKIYLDAPDYGVVTQYTTVWTKMEQANTEELTPALQGQRSAKEAVSRLVPRINALLQSAEMG